MLLTNISKYKALKSEKKSIMLLLNIGIPAIAFVLIIFFSNPVFLIFLLGVPIVTVPANLYAKIIMWKIRRQPIPCNACDGTMHILSEKKEDAYLSVAQQFEEDCMRLIMMFSYVKIVIIKQFSHWISRVSILNVQVVKPRLLLCTKEL